MYSHFLSFLDAKTAQVDSDLHALKLETMAADQLLTNMNYRWIENGLIIISLDFCWVQLLIHIVTLMAKSLLDISHG